MTVACTAKRRRRQARNRYQHLARIGRGNNNRPFYSMHSKEYYERKEQRLLGTLRAMTSRKKKK